LFESVSIFLSNIDPIGDSYHCASPLDSGP
jgi:hypothetical protein